MCHRRGRCSGWVGFVEAAAAARNTEVASGETVAVVAVAIERVVAVVVVAEGVVAAEGVVVGALVGWEGERAGSVMV